MNEKRLFKRYISTAIQSIKRAEKLLSVLKMDLDTFDNVLETLESLKEVR